MALDFYDYYFINIVALSRNIALATVLGIVYGLVFGAILYFAAKATKADPTDPTIYAEREAEAKGYQSSLHSHPSICRLEFDNSPY